MSKKNILLIGKNGQLGKSFIKHKNLLDAKFYKFSYIGRNILDLENSKDEIYNKVFNHYQPDLIINTAAYTKVDKAETFRDKSLKINGEALQKISCQCKKRNIPLVHFSTDYVFDGLGTKPWKTDDDLNPINHYGHTKLVGEKYIKKADINFIIFRVSWLFGYQGDNFVNTMLSLSGKKELKIVNDQFGGPTSTEYIANNVIKLIPHILRNVSLLNSSQETFPWGIYHLQGQPIVSWFEFADKIFRKACEIDLLKNYPILIQSNTKDYKTAASRPLNSKLDCSTTKELLGISQPLWEDDLKEYLINVLQNR